MTTPETQPHAAPDTPVEEVINLDEIASSVRETSGLGKKEPPVEDVDGAMAAKVDRYADEAADPIAEGVTFDEGTQRYRDAGGKFVKKDGTPDEAPPPASEAAPEPPPPDPAATTETDTKPAAKPAGFRILGTDGTEIDPATLPITAIAVKIAGEERTKTLPELIRLAQSGGYNEELHVQLKGLREYTPELERYATAMEQRVQAMEQRYAAILRDPHAYLAEQEQFEQAMTPEAEAARLRQELDAVHAREAEQAAVAHLAAGAEHLLAPKVEQILQQYPEVTGEEVVAHLGSLMAPYRQPNGQVHPTHLPAVAALLDRAVTPYVAQLHEARSDAKAVKAAQEAHAKAAQDAAERTAQEAAAKAKADAQQQVADAKRQLARQLAPSGGVSTSVPARPKPTSFNDTRAQQRAVEDAVNAVLGG